MDASILTNPWVIILFLAWTLPWKGAALWKAARSGSIHWFIILLLINTLSVLDIIYIFFIHPKQTHAQGQSRQ